jgi:hypothetical protein
MATALAYHPTISHLLRFTATTVGRDKVLRLVGDVYFEETFVRDTDMCNRSNISHAFTHGTKRVQVTIVNN